MRGLAKVLSIVIGVSLLATAAQAIPVISSVAVSYPVDSAHPTLTISGSDSYAWNAETKLGKQ